MDEELYATKLKTSLESWREVFLVIYSVLLWEKKWHPGTIAGGTSFVFLILWFLDPSVLTTFSIMGLTLTISDYIVPIISAAIFKPETWTPVKEQQFYDFCKHVVMYRFKLETWYLSFYDMRTTNPKWYYGPTIVTLAFLAWIGNVFSNLFLTYLLMLSLLLLPGVVHHGVINKSGAIISRRLSKYSKLKLFAPKKDQ